MSCSFFSLSRHRKIAILISVVASLFLLAFLSTYVAEEPDWTREKESHSGLGKRGRESHSHEKSGWKLRHRKGFKANSNQGLTFRGQVKSRKQEGGKGRPKRPHQQKGGEKESHGATISVKMAAKNDDRFDAQRVLQLFSSCRKTEDLILIDCYVDAYEELCKLFKAFGAVFGFVTSDVVEKIGILRDYRKSEESGKYETVQSMLSYEVSKSITNNKKKASGARTLLRLHRALEFIEELLVKIKNTDNKDKFSTVACKAYDDTLAKHHQWLVKKAVHVAMYVLPSRVELLKKMHIEDTANGMAALTKLIDELEIIYKITQDLYAKDKLLDLP